MMALSVWDNIIPYIANITDPAECWNVLRNFYANNTNSRKLMLKRRLTNQKLEEGGSMNDFLQNLKELINEFACIGETLTDDEVVEYALMALPESFESLVNTLMYRPALPSITELTAILMQEDIRHEVRSSRRGDGEALLTKSTGRPSFNIRKTSDEGRMKSKRPRGECHYCGGRDH